MVAARASRRAVASPGRRRGRTTSRSSDQRGSRRSTTPVTLPGPAAAGQSTRVARTVRGSAVGAVVELDPGRRHRRHRRRPPGFCGGRQPARPPPQDVLEPGQPVPRPPGAGQLVALPREQQQLRGHAAALELDVEPGALLERAAPVLLGVDDQRRRGDRRGVGHRALRGEPRRIGAQVLVGEDPADVGGPDEADRVDERPLADRRRRTATCGRSATWSGSRRRSRP